VSGVFAFFSIDGNTALAEFDNQNDGGDFGDWQSNPRRAGVPSEVQDAFTSPGVNPSLSVELNALDVIGYDRVAAAVAPSISSQPASQTIGSGSTATMSVTASGTAPLTYQWYVGPSGTTTSPIGGATAGSFTTPPLISSTSYWVRVSNTAGTADSNTATITVLPPPPIVTTGVATALGPTSATLNGTANPNGAATTANFEYGLTTSYGSTTPVQAMGSGGSPVPIGGGGITGLACGTYHFRAVAANSGGTTSGPDAAFTLSVAGCPFTDSPLTAGVTFIKAPHVLELRMRIDAIRVAVGLAPYAWTDALMTGSTLVRAVHITEMRAALEAAYIQAGRSAPTYTDPDLTIGTMIKAAHIEELRAAILAMES
jgi:hypothetical protein